MLNPHFNASIFTSCSKLRTSSHVAFLHTSTSLNSIMFLHQHSMLSHCSCGFNHPALYSCRLGTLQVCSWNAVNLAVLAAPASATLQCLELQCQLLLSLTPSCPCSSSICKHCSSGAALAASEGLDSAGTAGSLMLQSVRSTLPAPAPRRTGPRMQISHLPCLFY